MNETPRMDIDRAESIFWAVRTLPASERDRALARECGESSELRELVADLLEADSTDLAGFLPPAQRHTWEDPEPEVLTGGLGKYQLIGVLGRGGMGAVYEAEDPGLGRRVAIKLFPRELEGRGSGLDRIEEEARILARLNHPRIATIHSLEIAEKRHFFTLELAHGDTLRERVRRRALTSGETLALAAQIADALTYAHGRGVVHRDLKPENVKISSTGQIKILDFGIGALLERADGPAAETEDSKPRFGTPGFASPEQLLGAAASSTDDLWSLGALLFYAMTGRSPVAGNDPADLSRSTLAHELSWEALPSDAREELRSILERLLSREATVRGSSAELLDELEPWSVDAVRHLARGSETAEPAPNNLTPQPDRFVGRSRELAWLARAFEAPGLVSIVAVGGAGKSRLAVEYAGRSLQQFPGGVWFIELARIPRETDETEAESRLLEAIVREVGLRAPSQGALFEALVNHVSKENCLLVIDNCEHLPRACVQFIDRVRSEAPGLRLLVTSRVALGAKGENVLRLDLLRAPKSNEDETAAEASMTVDELAHLDSVRLLIDRLRVFHPSLGLTEANAGVISAICEQVEGHPLSLELVAAKSRLLGLEEIRSRLVHRLELLSHRGDSSQGSLHAALEWSWDLLSPDECVLLSRLSVFRGGFSPAAVEEVCAGTDASGGALGREQILELMEKLLDHSLVRVTQSGTAGESRHSLLEVVREFAETKLEPVDRPSLERRHRDTFLKLAKEAKRALGSEQSALSLERLEMEAGNLQCAIDWMRRTPSEGNTWLDFVGSLGNYWYLRAAFSEGARECRGAIDATREDPPSNVRWQAIVWYAHFLAAAGELRDARGVYEEALDVARHLGDGYSIAETLRSLAMVFQHMGEPDEARQRFEEAIEVLRKRDDPEGLAGVVAGLGNLESALGNLDEAERFLEEALELSRRDGSRTGEGTILRNLAGVAFRRRNYDTALRRYRLGLEFAREVGDVRGVCVTQFNIASVFHAQGSYEDARREGQMALRGLLQLEDRASAAVGLLSLVSIELDRGESARAAVLLAVSDALREEMGLELADGERRELEGIETRLESSLSPSHRRDCDALGRGMSFKRAVDYASDGSGE